jgi:hypothetical protein
MKIHLGKIGSYVLLIVVLAGVLVAGLFLVVYMVNQPIHPRVMTQLPPDPETVVAPDVKAAAINYSDKENDNGTITRTFTMGNSQYLTDKGKYAAINTAIVKTSGEYQYENTTNAFKTYFKNDGQAEDLIQNNFSGRTASFSFINAQKTSAKVEKNTVTYPAILAGFDAVYTVTENGMREELVAEKKTIVDSISQKIKLNGVYYKQEKDGSITFHDAGTKNLVFVIPAPVMYEKNDMAKNNFGLHLEISGDSGRYVISKVIDATGKKWLETATYPVAIDFSTQTLNFSNGQLTMEFFQLDYTPPTCYTPYVNSIFRAGKGPGGNRYQSYFSFDTSSIDNGASVISADLTIYLYSQLNQQYARIYSQADLWSSGVMPGAVCPTGWFNDGAPGSAHRESDILLNGLPNSDSDCAFNNSSCQRHVNVWGGSVSGTGHTQFIVPFFGNPADGELLYLYSSLSSSSLQPSLSVTYVTGKPILQNVRALAPGQLTFTLIDNSDWEDLWAVERSSDGNWPGTTICNNTFDGGVRTGSGTADCIISGTHYATYTCATTSGGINGSCTITDLFANTTPLPNHQYYYRAYAYPLQDPHPPLW